MHDVLASLLSQTVTQWIALLTGLAYVFLAAYEKPLCWPFGIISCALIAFDDFTQYQLLADGVLQICYVVFGFIGIWYWIFRREDDGTIRRVRRISLRTHLLVIGLAALLSIPAGHLLTLYANAAFGYLDTLTTLLSLWATWLLVKKNLSNWLYWIGIDFVYVGLFWLRGGSLIAVLYFIYLCVAVLGYVQWRRSWQRNQSVYVSGQK